MRMMILAIHPSPVAAVPPDMVQEFERLLSALDLRRINRAGWDRLKEIIVEAMVESVLGGSRDADIRGLQGIEMNLPKWQLSEHYDGRP